MISLKRVSKAFGSIRAVDHVSLEILAGQVVVIQGPSGSGKTTLLRLIAGLELPDSGVIALDDEVVSAVDWATPPHSRGIGIVFQRSALWPHMTVAQNLCFAMNGLSKAEADAHLHEILERVVLTDLRDRYPSQLSGGEARRVAVGRAMAARPKRLLLDEPLTSLDPELKGRLLTAILEYAHETGATVLYITHDREEARAVGHVRLCMERGRIVG